MREGTPASGPRYRYAIALAERLALAERVGGCAPDASEALAGDGGELDYLGARGARFDREYAYLAEGVHLPG